jgi:hypothetical protein
LAILSKLSRWKIIWHSYVKPQLVDYIDDYTFFLDCANTMMQLSMQGNQPTNQTKSSQAVHFFSRGEVLGLP